MFVSPRVHPVLVADIEVICDNRRRRPQEDFLKSVITRRRLTAYGIAAAVVADNYTIRSQSVGKTSVLESLVNRVRRLIRF